MKTIDHAIIREATLAGDFFIWNRIHMNASGKTLKVNIIASNITNMLP
jgi:hypothetical protein